MPGFSIAGKRIWVAGHRGMLGSALVRRLASEPCEILTSDRAAVDLRQQGATEDFVQAVRPDAIVVAAAKVGGILANSSYPAEFLYDNLLIAANIIEAARRANVTKLLFAGSSCIYPKHAAQPMAEEALLTGALEPTNEPYAIAKIAGIKLCQAYRAQYGCDFISAMPTNLYGPNDNFDLVSSHVLPALLRKAHEAKGAGEQELVIWGSGTPRREFLHVDDCADALVYLLQRYSAAMHINVGCGEDVSIAELARLVADVVGFTGGIALDRTKPDGAPRKLLDISRMRALGWRPRYNLWAGVVDTYAWYLRHGVARGQGGGGGSGEGAGPVAG